jgi:hypothetical protein
MKKVYVIMMMIDYEGDIIKAVYADEDTADYRAEELNKGGRSRYHVEEWEVS